MNRRNFIQTTAISGAGLIGTSQFKPANAMNLFDSKKSSSLMGGRFVTLCIMIRTTLWEVSRDVKLIQQDESAFHTLKVVRDLRETFVYYPELF